MILGFGKTGRKYGKLGHNEGIKIVFDDLRQSLKICRVEGIPNFLMVFIYN